MLKKTIISVVFILAMCAFAFGQQVPDEDENWLKGFRTEADLFPRLAYWTKRFTADDLAKGKQRLNSIREFAPENEWEGVYYANTEIGDERFVWNAKGGFFRFYFYHELKGFNFGSVADSNAFIELIYEKAPASGGKTLSERRLVKVKIDEKHFLVPENRLSDFCERAAGLSTDLTDFSYYWIKHEDFEKETFGLPILPDQYKSFLRRPIETEIIGVGSRKIEKRESNNEWITFYYPVTIGAGKNKRVKSGMNFFVEDLGEWIEIKKVFRNRSVGIIKRPYSSNKQETCFDGERGSGQIIVCKEIKTEMKTKTKSSSF